MTDNTLKPCPFCGKSNVKTFGPYGWYRNWGISHSCRTFYSGAQELAQGFHTKADAIAAWNTRAAAPDTVTLDRALVEDDFAPIWDDSILLAEHKAVHASVAVGGWLSAALDDPNVCDAMKADVNRWFSAGFLYLDEVRKIMQAHRIASDLAGYERGQRETVERIVAWLRGIGFGDEDQNRAKFEIMKAIEAGEWK